MTRSMPTGLALLALALVFTLIPVGGLNVICWITAVIFLAYWATHRIQKDLS